MTKLRINTREKGLILITAVLLTIGTFFTLVFLKVQLGEPKLRTEFCPPPSWQIGLWGVLEVSIGVVSGAWLLAWAKDIRVTVVTPKGFTISRTGSNECELNFFMLHGGDGFGNGFTTIVSNNIPLGNYTITIKIYGKNVLEKILTPKLMVAA